MFSNYFNAVKTKEEKDKFIIECLIPGVNKEDVEVSFDKNLISIVSKKETFFGNKYDYKSKLMTNYTDKTLDFDNVKAILKNGILTIEIPLKASKRPIKMIKIDE